MVIEYGPEFTEIRKRKHFTQELFFRIAHCLLQEKSTVKTQRNTNAPTYC